MLNKAAYITLYVGPVLIVRNQFFLYFLISAGCREMAGWQGCFTYWELIRREHPQKLWFTSSSQVAHSWWSETSNPALLVSEYWRQSWKLEKSSESSASKFDFFYKVLCLRLRNKYSISFVMWFLCVFMMPYTDVLLQALAQCENTLTKMGLVREAVDDTAGAAKVHSC